MKTLPHPSIDWALALERFNKTELHAVLFKARDLIDLTGEDYPDSKHIYICWAIEEAVRVLLGATRAYWDDAITACVEQALDPEGEGITVYDEWLYAKGHLADGASTLEERQLIQASRKAWVEDEIQLLETT